jgi:hypothetical protein
MKINKRPVVYNFLIPCRNKLEYFSLSFTPTLVQHLRDWNLPRGPLTGRHSMGGLYFEKRLRWKLLTVTNTLAYYNAEKGFAA